VHPVIKMNNEEMKKWREAVQFPSFRHSVIPSLDTVTLFTHGRLEAGKGLDIILRVYERIKREKWIMNDEEAVPVIARSTATKQSIPWIPAVVDTPSEWQTPVIANGVKQSMELNHGSPRNSPEFLAMTGDQIDVMKPDMNIQYSIPNTATHLIIFWTGSLETELREKWIDVRPFDREKTFSELSSGQYGHVLGVYCSEIDGFGMAPLECQMTGVSTVILDRAGARETIVTDVSGEPVWYLVDSEESLFSTVSYYLAHKMFPEQLSIVNFSHQKSYFLPERLSRDLLSVISKIGV
jgi:glycosyltransferase involved in cell wall biosynthesis